MTVAQPLIQLDASYARAVPRLSVAWSAAAVPAPKLLVLNEELADELYELSAGGEFDELTEE